MLSQRLLVLSFPSEMAKTPLYELVTYSLNCAVGNIPIQFSGWDQPAARVIILTPRLKGGIMSPG